MCYNERGKQARTRTTAIYLWLEYYSFLWSTFVFRWFFVVNPLQRGLQSYESHSTSLCIALHCLPLCVWLTFALRLSLPGSVQGHSFPTKSYFICTLHGWIPNTILPIHSIDCRFLNSTLP